MNKTKGLSRTHRITLAMVEISEDIHRHVQSVVTEMGLTPVQAAVLRFSDHPTRMGVLAEHIGCQPSHITSVVDALEDRGWVRRDVDPEDRRVMSVARTAQGQKAGEEIMERISATTSPMLANLSDAEQRTLLELMYKAIGHNTKDPT